MKVLKDPKGRLICIIAVLILCVISSFVINIVRGKYYDTFVQTEGKVTDIEFLNNYPEKYAKSFHRLRHRGKKATHRIYYSFTVDEKVYGSCENFYKNSYPSQYRVGDAISVWYNPEYPDHSLTYEPSPGLEVLIPYFIAAPVIVSIATAKRNAKGRALYSD